MDNNILLETTVKSFENGIEEVKNVKKSIVKLSDVIKELVEFNDIFNLDIDSIKLDEVQNVIDEIISQQKNLSKQYKSSINKLKKSQENDLDKISQSMDGFLIETEKISDKIQNMSQNININKIEDISKQADKFLENIKNQYAEFDLEVKKITELGEGIENLKQTVEEINEKVKSEDIEERMASLEEKMIFLIDENQNLKKLYSQKDNLDDNFKNKILYIINQNLKNVGNNNCNEENTEDKHELAMNYLKRYDENEDLKKAIELFEISSEQGNNESSFNLAEIYYYGKGVEKDFTLALKYYLKAANNGHTKSAQKVIKIYEGKANIGELEYSRLLGDIYLKGKMVKKDIQKAIKWYEVSAESGSKDTVGILIALYELLSNQNDVNAKLRLGEIYHSDKWGNKDNFKAFELYESAEKQGHFEVKNRAGQVACEIGEEMLYSDVNHAIEWYKIAAGKGNAEAQYKLGDIYHKGKVVPKDEEKAVIYYQMAADQGHLLALTQIKIIKPFSKLFK